MSKYASVVSHGTNRYFNNFTNSGEQKLLEDLIVESIKIYGHDILYLPREIVSKDEIYTEDDQSAYNNSYSMEVYIKNVDGFDGDGTFFSKFGPEFRDQVTFVVAKRTFAQELPSQERPNEGDVIYFPMNGRLFQIRYVNYKPFFYPLGTLQTWEMVCELFEYSGERFNTGNDIIDQVQQNNSTVIQDYAIMTEDGNYLMTEDDNFIVNEKYKLKTIVLGSDNEDIQNEAGTGTETDQPYANNTGIHDWTYFDPWSEGKY